MGLAIHTQQTFDYVLVEDRKLPPERQRKLVFRNLSARDHMRVEAMLDASHAAATLTDALAKACEAIRVPLVGWSGFDGREYRPEDLDDVLSAADIGEVRSELLVAMTVSETDRKKSAWQSLSTSDSSAGPTAAAGA